MSGGGTGSGSGGFYKYRCKYYYTHDCVNWVYVSNAACAHCLAEGRDSFKLPAHAQAHLDASPRDIYVPYFDGGVLKYSLMEIIATDQQGYYWELREKAANPPPMSLVPTTSAQPPPPSFVAGSTMQPHPHA